MVISEGINIFGAGVFARSVAAAAREQGIVVHAFLVSQCTGENIWDGIPVRRVDDSAVARVPMWIGVFNRESHSDYSALRRTLSALMPHARLVWPQEYYAQLADALGWRFWLKPLDAYIEVESQIATARRLMEDTDSRDAFDSLLNFRRLANADWESPKPSGELQYLPTWLRGSIRGPLRMVDAGAYRGETLRDLAAVVTIDEAWTFEPDPGNYEMLVQNVSDIPTRITHIPAGLSAQCGVAQFDSGRGESSNFAATGTSQVPLVTLDTCLQGAPVNFIKIDIEGHEMQALQGARTMLERQRPILAIAGYHCWDDLWKIPIFLDSLRLGYRLRLGLHGHNSFDSVFYAY